jgi:DNA-binding XRE family transcriptional regulator
LVQDSVLPDIDIRGIRDELGLSQSELAEQAGISTRALQSYEQGWRKPPEAVERLVLLLLIAIRHGASFGKHMCWETENCDPAIRERCVAYRTRQGHLCWFLTGTLCRGNRLKSWAAKKATCGKCKFMHLLLSSE